MFSLNSVSLKISSNGPGHNRTKIWSQQKWIHRYNKHTIKIFRRMWIQKYCVCLHFLGLHSWVKFKSNWVESTEIMHWFFRANRVFGKNKISRNRFDKGKKCYTIAIVFLCELFETFDSRSQCELPIATLLRVSVCARMRCAHKYCAPIPTLIFSTTSTMYKRANRA